MHFRFPQQSGSCANQTGPRVLQTTTDSADGDPRGSHHVRFAFLPRADQWCLMSIYVALDLTNVFLPIPIRKEAKRQFHTHERDNGTLWQFCFNGLWHLPRPFAFCKLTSLSLTFFFHKWSLMNYVEWACYEDQRGLMRTGCLAWSKESVNIGLSFPQWPERKTWDD